MSGVLWFPLTTPRTAAVWAVPNPQAGAIPLEGYFHVNCSVVSVDPGS
jgi:hypothetical protein